MSPTYCTGRSAYTFDGAHGTSGIRAQITAHAPSTGISAAVPGNAVCALNVAHAYAIAARPAHVTTARAGAITLVGRSIASRPPKPNSHARVGVMKYAAAGSDPVLEIEY